MPNRVIAECIDGWQAVRAAEQGADVILLDIRMPGFDGLQAARELLRQPEPPRVIFTTAYEQHALDAFEVQAVDYLVKPVRRERLLAALQRVQPAERDEKAQLPRGARRYFTVSERGRLVLVPAVEVIYLRAEMKYLTLVTAEREYLIEDSLVNIEREFGERFLRIHRNCLVLAEAIEAFERISDEEGEGQWVVTLRDLDVRLPVSRRQHSAVRRLAKSVRE